MYEEAECPRCDHTISVEIEDCEDSSLQVKCENCGATLEVTIQVEIGVDVSDVPPAEFDCPECDHSMSIEDIETESGSEEIECENCHATLDVTWSDWGKDISIDIIESSEDYYDLDEDEEEDEDEEDEDEQDEDDEDW